ncbi:MAG: 3,4-dihydroxy-2-butanone-4-phosphate synthase [Actinobacteria bacterium]|nr:3,4-dihydroxy-2-butanone-4-phosphate synthase [Actinomycetota bacterium]
MGGSVLGGTPSTRLAAAESQLSAGGIVVLCEPEAATASKADLVLAAGQATPEAVNLLITHGHGVLYALMSAERCERLGLSHLIERDSERWITAMATSIEARVGVTTGISAADRARTLRVAGDPGAGPDDLVQPGHVFPMAARRGGLRARVGRTEATIELLALAGLFPVAASCELMNEDGATMSVTETVAFAAESSLPVVTVGDVLGRRLEASPMLLAAERRVESATWGPLVESVVTTFDGDPVHRAIRGEGTRVERIERVHVLDACVLGDAFDACPEGCGERLRSAMDDLVAGENSLVLHLAAGVQPADPSLTAALAVPVLVALGLDLERAIELADPGRSAIAPDEEETDR